MVAPEVVGHFDPVYAVVLRRTARRQIDRVPWKDDVHGGHSSRGSVTGAPRFLIGGPEAIDTSTSHIGFRCISREHG
jgi:hypothetical protein